MSARDDAARAEIRALHAARPVNRFLRGSVALLVLLTAYCWCSGEFADDDVFGKRSRDNVAVFVKSVEPHVATERPGGEWAALRAWSVRLMEDVPPGERDALAWRPSGGWTATWQTLAMSIVAIVLAGLGAALLSVPAARNVATPEPFLPGPSPPSPLRRGAWCAVRWTTRLLLVFLRAIPEYVWAFLLIGILGLSAWPAVLALALHNAGIMGKLGSETIESLDRAVPAALRGMGGTRVEIVAFGIYPVALPRWLLFFFYRWETCVREATVLGMLGVTTLGSLIIESRVRGRYDEMMFYVLLGAALVLVGDLVSAVARSLVRRAS